MTDKSIEQRQSSSASQEGALQESLSALVDDQASDMELRRLLKQDDPGLNDRWSRYQMIGSIMRAEPVSKETDLLSGIQSALAEEAPLSKNTGGFWSGASRFAIAASVAGAIVLGAQQNWQQQLGLEGEQDLMAEASAKPVLSQPSLVQQPVMAVGVTAGPSRSASPAMVNRNSHMILVPRNQAETSAKPRFSNEEIQKRLNALMLEHANNAATNSGRGVLPYARIPKIEE